jgi:hypothetical protein
MSGLQHVRNDKDLARRALDTLQRLPHVNRVTAVRDLLRLQDEVGRARIGDAYRTEAWLAICQLWSSLKENTGADISGLWENAISRTDAWKSSIK